MLEIELLKTIFKDSPDILKPLNEIDKEIERLKGLCDKYEEEHKTTFEEWKKTINIIEEVRESINKKLNINSDYVDYDFGTELLRQELLEILDKGKE